MPRSSGGSAPTRSFSPNPKRESIWRGDWPHFVAVADTARRRGLPRSDLEETLLKDGFNETGLADATDAAG
mgnify:CR=1 FL=1